MLVTQLSPALQADFFFNQLNHQGSPEGGHCQKVCWEEANFDLSLERCAWSYTLHFPEHTDTSASFIFLQD